MAQYATNTQSTVHLKWTNCYSCGVPFGMVDTFYNDRLRDHRTFYCPNGHGQCFTGKSEAEKLREQLAFANSRAERLRMERDAEARSKAAVRGHLTRIKRRIANGVCPCCNRTFQDVMRHMASQHPAYIEDLKAKEEGAAT